MQVPFIKKLILAAAFGAGSFLIFPGDGPVRAQAHIALVEEDQEFWENFLGQKEIHNRNMLYASYMAYRERLTDLSIESFQECIKRNETNSPVKALSIYYIGKNYYLLGRYVEAIRYFSEASGMELGRFSHLSHAIMLNMAITHLKMNNVEQFRRIVQSVINSDEEGKYKVVGQALLNQMK